MSRGMRRDGPFAGLEYEGGTKFLRETATRGVDTGGEVVWRTRDGVDRMHLRFYCRFAQDACWPHHFVKLRALKDGFDGDRKSTRLNSSHRT